MEVGPAGGARAPTLLSLAALVLSVAAFLNASHSNRKFDAILNEGARQVTLTELAIYQDNIVENAVGTAQLQNGAVTTSKLAPMAITSSRLADAAVTIGKLDPQVLNHMSALAGIAEIVAGDVNEEGTIVRGKGFASQRISTGEYTLTFEGQFQSAPIVIAVAQSYGVCYVLSQAEAVNTVHVKCMSDLLGSAPIVANTRFSFFAHASDQ